MLRRWLRLRSRSFTLLFGLLAAGFVITIITYPDQAFQASLQGLKLWWDQVFPALLPVLVITELLLGFGMVHALGVLLEPLMRLVFRLPGPAGWAMAAGMIGGYPLGADATAKLRKRSDIGLAEGQRLLALSHICNPMFIVGVVGAGFLRSPEAGAALAILHVAAAAAAALIQRGYSPDARKRKGSSLEGNAQVLLPPPAGGWSSRMYRAMSMAHREDGRAFGKLLGDAVTNAIQALMMVGGLMMIFSVAIRLIDIRFGGAAVTPWLTRLLPGLLEPHLGAYAVSGITGWIPAFQAACIGAVLAWSGLSLHAQVMAFARSTGLRYGPFLRFRLLHAATAFVLTLAAWQPLGRLLTGTETVFSPEGGWSRLPAELPGGWNIREAAALWGGTLTLLVLVLALMLLLSLLIRLLERTAGREPRS
ncbi:nucleoside recognition domain-containing protein [Gorillibacterium sp. sgz5001074]|uniref:nucleoside recognition domain-containing protein n=1 Tax=Gorillibacterium sp. sgz5001074 TaxID=3446695 RepID=UPI003F672856